MQVLKIICLSLQLHLYIKKTKQTHKPVFPDLETEENIDHILGSYVLRGRRVEKSVIPETKYETLTFKHFFPKLIKTFRNFDFSLRRDPFRLQVNLNLNENLKTFLTSFPKFDIKFSAFHRKKMKKQNQKETRKRKGLRDSIC